MNMKATVIFDNAGGVTLQLTDRDGLNYAHYYQRPEEAANELYTAFRDDDLSAWEGHDPDAEECDPTDDQMANGGYKVAVYRTWPEVVNDALPDTGWLNIRDFDAAIKELSERAD